ncbi:MAG: diguanylate cyclase [Oscillospiraceae bacterium]|nr:diguanylate cyclase [Oscillospiraceae bacterium]
MNEVVSGILILALVATTYIFVLVINQHDSNKRTYFLLLIACVWLYVMGYLFEMNCITTEASFMAHMVMYTGACFVAAFFLLFVLDYLSYKIKPWWVMLLVGLSTANFIFAVTSPFHKLYYEGYWVEHSTALYHFSFEPGPLYMPLHLVHYVAVAVAVVLLVLNFFRASVHMKYQAPLLLIAGIIPVVGNVLFALRLNLLQGINLTPLSMVLSIYLFYVAIKRFNLFGLIPLASKQAIKSMKELYIILDKNKFILEANPAAVEMFPELSSDMGKLTFDDVKSWAEVVTEEAFDKSLTLQKNIEITLSDKSVHHFRLSTTPIYNNEKLLGWLILLHDVTDTVDLVNKLEQQATTDALTGIRNRLFFMEHATVRLQESKRKEETTAILLFDIDEFKSVNDTYGHTAGDEILRSTVSVVSKLLRPYDLFARYGGEEFILMLSDANEEMVKDVAERIRRAVEGHTIVYEDASINRTVSIGVALSKNSSAQLQTMIDAADTVLYNAKESGKNKVSLQILG